MGFHVLLHSFPLPTSRWARLWTDFVNYPQPVHSCSHLFYPSHHPRLSYSAVGQHTRGGKWVNGTRLCLLSKPDEGKNSEDESLQWDVSMGTMGNVCAHEHWQPNQKICQWFMTGGRTIGYKYSAKIWLKTQQSKHMGEVWSDNVEKEWEERSICLTAWPVVCVFCCPQYGSMPWEWALWWRSELP